MIKNKWFKSMLALALAFCMVLPHLAFHADEKNKLNLKSSRYNDISNVGYFVLQNTYQRTLVNEVKVNGEGFTFVEDAYRTLTEKQYTLHESDPDVMIYGVKDEDRIELITDYGVLEFRIKDINNSIGGVHDVDSVTYRTKEEEPQNPGQGEGQDGGQDSNPGQDQDGGSGQTQSDLKILSIRKPLTGSYHIVEFETAAMAKSVEGVRVNQTGYNKADKNISFEKELYFIQADEVSNRKELHVSELRDNDELAIETAKGTTKIKIIKANSYSDPDYNPDQIVFEPKGGEAPPKPDEEGGDSPAPDNGDLKFTFKVYKEFSKFYIESNIDLDGKIKSFYLNGIQYEPVTSSYLAWYNGKYYIEGKKIYFYGLKDGDTLQLVDVNGKSHVFSCKEVNGDLVLEALAGEIKDKELKIRLRGYFEAAMVNQRKYDGISSATTGGALGNKNSHVVVEVAEFNKGEEPGEKDWVLLHKSGLSQKEMDLILDAESGMSPVYNKLDSSLTLSGTPKKAGKYEVQVRFKDAAGRESLSNALPFNVYGYDEKLIDHFTVQNSKKMQDGKYMWDMEPWVIQHFGGENETVVAPSEIKAMFGSHVSGTYGLLGQAVEGEPTQTLIVGEDTNLTLVNMMILSSVKIVVQDGGVLNLMDSSLHGRVIVKDGGRLQVNYDARNKKFSKGSSINGQVELQDGGVLEHSLIYSNTNYVPNGNKARQNIEPVVVVKGKATIEGSVLIRGDEAPTGTDPKTGKTYTGQPALLLSENASLSLKDKAVLGLYGGGKSALTTYGAPGLILEEGSKVEGQGTLIAVAGNTNKGDGAAAVAGKGLLAVKQLYLQGGNTTVKKAEGGKAIEDTVTIDMAISPVGQLLKGKAGAGLVSDDQVRYWDSITSPPDLAYLNDEENRKAIVWSKPEGGNNSNDNGNAGGNDNNDNGNSGGNDNNDNGNAGGNDNNGNGNSGGSNNNGNGNAGGNNNNDSGNAGGNDNNGNGNAGGSNNNDSGNAGGNDNNGNGNAGGSNNNDSGNSGNNNRNTGGDKENSKPLNKTDNENANSSTTIIDEEKTPLSKLDDRIAKELEAITMNQQDKDLVSKLLKKELSNKEFINKISDKGLMEYAEDVDKVLKDESANSWYAKELGALRLMKLIKGYEDGSFRPNNSVTGRELVVILVRAGEWKVEETGGHWFEPYLKLAKEKNLLDGIDIDLSKAVSREEVAAITFHFVKEMQKTNVSAAKEADFKDRQDISEQYLSSVDWLAEKGVLKGLSDGRYAPKNMLKRSEVVVILYRLLGIM